MNAGIYLVATPIGNLKDMTFRAVEVLKEVDIIAAEDTRNTIKLLNHFGIETLMTSYHEYNKIEKANKLIDMALEGKSIALVTDAGMPAISDPGEDLVKLAYDAGIAVSVIPGASAVVSALSISGLATRRFCFEAFLPTDKKERREILLDLKNEIRTVILYEAPHRLTKTLAELAEYLGENRKISIVRELTKKHEEVIILDLKDALDLYNDDNKPRGEFVVLIEGKSREEIEKEEILKWEKMSIREHYNLYADAGYDKKDAMKMVAKDRGMSKREIYKELL